MRFDILAALLLITPALAAPLNDPNLPVGPLEPGKKRCNIVTHYEKHWAVGLHFRYRVQATAYKNDDDISEDRMVQDWCLMFGPEANDPGRPGLLGSECWSPGQEKGVYKDGRATADVTTFAGRHGWNLYKDAHQRTVNKWRAEYGCDVDSKW